MKKAIIRLLKVSFILIIALKNVGAARLERATACTPCKNASQLHHAPKAFALQNYNFFEYNHYINHF